MTASEVIIIVNVFRLPAPAFESVAGTGAVSGPSSLSWEFGDQYCSARGCVQKTGLACSFIDDRDCPCPTAWCPEHRYISSGAVFCLRHQHHLAGPAALRPVATGDLPAVMAWIVQDIDTEISMAMLGIAMEWHQALVLDPVHFSLVGVARAGTWERAWKVCDGVRATLCVVLAIAEADPHTVETLINSRPAIRLSLPWPLDRESGSDSTSSAGVPEFRRSLLGALVNGISAWRHDHLGNREPFLDGGTALRGHVQPGFADSAPGALPPGS